MTAPPRPATHRLATRRPAVDVSLAALLAALVAACALVAVPLGIVPGTMQVFAVVVVALMARRRVAALAMGAYLLAGAAGLPVFAGMKGGLGVLAGPTGGYLVGFAAGAIAGSAVRMTLEPRVRPLIAGTAAAATVIACTYLLGWAWLAFGAGVGPLKALLAGVVPFVVPDLVKAGLALAAVSGLASAGVAPAHEGAGGRA